MDIILIVALAVIIAGTRLAFEFVRRNDEKAGLHIARSEYTVWGTFKDLFRTKEGRERAANGDTFLNYMKTDASVFYVTSAVMLVTNVVSGLLLYFAGSNGFIYSAMASVLTVLLIASKSFGIYVLSFVLSILAVIYGFMNGTWFGIVGAVGSIPVLFLYIKKFLSYRKTRVAKATVC